MNINNYDFFLFDLDNTVYNEFDFLSSVYQYNSTLISRHCNVDYDKIFDDFVNYYKSYGNYKIYDFIEGKYNLNQELKMILIVNQHNHLIPNSIKLDNQVTSVLKLLRKTQKSLFIVTNGTPKQQRNKVKCIDWCDLEKDIEFIFANEIYPKPNKLLFDYIEGKFCVNRKKAIYIGDSNTDREFANNSNINFKYMKDFINENINSFTSYR